MSIFKKKKKARVVKRKLHCRNTLANKQGFTNNDYNLREILFNPKVDERLWITVSKTGRVIVYYDAGNSWCDIEYDSAKDIKDNV